MSMMASNELFRLQSQDFDSTVKNSWKEIQSKNEYCDVTIGCDYMQVETHRFVILSFSPVLKEILKQRSNSHPFI